MPTPLDSQPPETLPGVYLLLIRLPPGRGFHAKIHGGPLRFHPGWYAYIGRDKRALAPRIARHLRTTQHRKWHVDYLLAAGKIADIQLRITREPADECRLAAEIARWPGADPVPGFGAGDCNCSTHLYYFKQRPGQSIHARRFNPETIRELFGRLDGLWEDHASHPHPPFRTLVACILSLRTQDPVTAAAAERLFAVLRTPRDFAGADPEDIARLIFPVGMYRQKSRRLVEIARRIVRDFHGAVPADFEALTALPGVGRKTANLVLSFAFGKPVICVDTHVHRISNRLGLVRTATPEETESALLQCVPPEFRARLNPYMVQHGQQICRPTGPRCAACSIADLCGFADLRRERRVLDAIPAAPPHPCLKHWNPAPAGAGSKGPAPAPFSRPPRGPSTPSGQAARPENL